MTSPAKRMSFDFVQNPEKLIKKQLNSLKCQMKEKNVLIIVNRLMGIQLTAIDAEKLFHQRCNIRRQIRLKSHKKTEFRLVIFLSFFQYSLFIMSVSIRMALYSENNSSLNHIT